jgi:hypothetical protein
MPYYKVDIFDNGIVEWNGIEYVSKLGKREWELSSKKVGNLNVLIEEFDHRTYEYRTLDGFATDHPNCIITIEFNDGFVKEIDHYLGDQLEEEHLVDFNKVGLYEFENKIERIVGTKKYVKEPLYLFHVTNKEDRVLKGAFKAHIVVANNEESALSIIPLGIESLDKSGELVLKKDDWVIRKIGRDTTDNLYPYVLMSEKEYN